MLHERGRYEDRATYRGEFVRESTAILAAVSEDMEEHGDVVEMMEASGRGYFSRTNPRIPESFMVPSFSIRYLNGILLGLPKVRYLDASDYLIR